MLREFKAFLAQGNVVGLAVAVVMGAAFGLVVASFTNDILMQVVAAIGAKPSFEALAFNLNGTPIRYGAFLNALISFAIVAFAMFLVIKLYNRFVKKEKPAAETELDLLRQIRDSLNRQQLRQP